ncbi:ATP-binding protein [Micromonospora sp. NPDC047467]|uniref:sensor histidine kinase n=1 Tax=Micromonospora sp. NPDC047467 TaxID=3154814 RepID=UPI0033FFBE0D
MGRFARWRRTVRAQGHRLRGALRPGDKPDPLTEPSELTEPHELTGSDELAGPAPSLNRLDALVEGFAAGQPVRWSLAGPPRPLSGAVDAAAYRIIEESLTNARRHAPGARVAVRLRYDVEGITIEVRDEGAEPEQPAPVGETGPVGEAERAGRGLLAVRRRAERVGGTFSAGPRPDGGFAVRVFLPAPEELAE